MAKEQGQTSSGRPRATNASATRAGAMGHALGVGRQRVLRLLLWRPHDPGLAALRRAVRVALVIPLALVFALFVIRIAQATIYVAFGCFALLALGDFAGRRPQRAAAYLGATLVGAALVALGTLVSFNPWVGAVTMLLIGFVLSFAGVFGGYVAAAQSPLLLVFVLSVGVPATPAAIPARLLGWGVAGGFSLVASVALWPWFERISLRSQAAVACHALAAFIRVKRIRPPAADLENVRRQAETAIQAVARAYAATPTRPAGPAQHDRAFTSLLSELERIGGYVTRTTTWSLAAQHPCLLEGDALAAAVAETLEASGDVLTGGAPPDLAKLQSARLAHRFALDRWAADTLRAGSQPEEALAGFEADNPLRVVAMLAQALGADALIAMGRPLPQDLQLSLAVPQAAGATELARRISATVRTHLHLRSSVFQNSLRVALGLTLAALLGGALQVAHAFWVVLGALSALRSSALATGRTTVQALVGTAVGVVMGAPLIYFVGKDTAVLWVVFPIAIFLAAYATTVVGFVAGQAAFTLFIMILFNLIAPTGWTLGLVRLQDVALGVGISALVGLLLWPRGLRAELRRALADLYHAVADDLAAAFNQILGLGAAEAFLQARDRAIRTVDRAGEAFDQYARERGSRHLALEIASSLGVAGRTALVAGDLLNALADTGYRAAAPSAADGAFLGQVRALTQAYAQVGAQLDQALATTGRLPEPLVSEAVLRAAMLDVLQRWKEDRGTEQAAVAIVAAGEWTQSLAELVADQETAVMKVVEAARIPWWR